MLKNDFQLDKQNDVHYGQRRETELEEDKKNSYRKTKEQENESSRKNVKNYKGVHYKKEKQVRYYEHGAHFKYQELYDILSKLVGEPDTNCETVEISQTNTKTKFSLKSLETTKKDSKKTNKHSSTQNNLELKETIDNNKNISIVNQNKYNSTNASNSNKGIFKGIKPSQPSILENFTYESEYSQKKISLNQPENKKSSIILPPINKKIENLEFVKSKIDTGLKLGPKKSKKL